MTGKQDPPPILSYCNRQDANSPPVVFPPMQPMFQAGISRAFPPQGVNYFQARANPCRDPTSSRSSMISAATATTSPQSSAAGTGGNPGAMPGSQGLPYGSRVI